LNVCDLDVVAAARSLAALPGKTQVNSVDVAETDGMEKTYSTATALEATEPVTLLMEISESLKLLLLQEVFCFFM
jgi:hypothetical protein